MDDRRLGTPLAAGGERSGRVLDLEHVVAVAVQRPAEVLSRLGGLVRDHD